MRERPQDLERSLRRSIGRDEGLLLTPRDAWAVYRRFSGTRCSADSGWLVQYGVYDFSGRDMFQFSLVRQLNTLETWNDEFVQIELLLDHVPTPTLIELGSWNRWSSDEPTLAAFFAACEADRGVNAILADPSREWKWRLRSEET